MKTALISLFILTTAIRPSKEQTGAYQVATPCGNRAHKCWTDQVSGIKQTDDAFDILGGCKLFKKYATCFDAVFRDASCTDDPTVTAVNTMAIADRNGLCLGDGSVSNCGNDVQECFNIVKKIKGYTWTGHEDAACPTIANLTHCTSRINMSPTCNGNVKVVLKDLQDTLYQGSLFGGCDGACGKKLGNCLENLTSVMVNGDFINVDWKNYCTIAYTGVGCIINLKSDPDCAHDDMVSQMTDPSQMKINTFCIGAGKPSPCIEQIKYCTAAWRTASAVDGQQCQAASTYLRCSNGVSCAKQIPDILTTLRNSIESIETKTSCPIVGSCRERLDVCNSKQEEVNKTRASNQVQYCVAVKTAVTCFNSFRQDTFCRQENLPLSDFETSVWKSEDTPCKDCQGQMSISVFLLTIALLFSFTRMLL